MQHIIVDDEVFALWSRSFAISGILYWRENGQSNFVLWTRWTFAQRVKNEPFMDSIVRFVINHFVGFSTSSSN